MIRDLYDNSIVAYKTVARQTVNLVLDTIRSAMKNVKKEVAAELRLHSDQGFQYYAESVAFYKVYRFFLLHQLRRNGVRAHHKTLECKSEVPYVIYSGKRTAVDTPQNAF